MFGLLKKIYKCFCYFIKIKHLKQKGVFIANKVDIDFNSTIFGYHVNLAHHSQLLNSKIDDYTSIGRYSKINRADIGKFCSISWDCSIGATEHNLHSISTHAFTYRKKFGFCNKDEQIAHKKVIIENDVWIGCGVIIMPGVHVGNGAVIGGGAVVTKDVKPYEIVAGCPAKHINWRFSQDLIDELLKIQWWNLDKEFIKRHLDLFSYSNDLSQNKEIIEKLKKLIKKEITNE